MQVVRCFRDVLMTDEGAVCSVTLTGAFIILHAYLYQSG